MSKDEIIADLREQVAELREEKRWLREQLEGMRHAQEIKREKWRNDKRPKGEEFRENSDGNPSGIPSGNGGNHIGGGPTYPPSSGGGATSSLTSSPSDLVTPLPPCSPSLSTVRSVFDAYQAAIQPHARLIDAAKDKIRARLRVFSEAELREAIRRFAADSWEMEHNAGRGAAWFFDSDKRIEGYVNLPPRNGNGNGHGALREPAGMAALREYQRIRDGRQAEIIEGEIA